MQLSKTLRSALFVTSATVFAVGCGSSGKKAEQTKHIDGRLKLANISSVTLELESGKTQKFTIRESDRDDVRIATVQALVAAEVPVRVTYSTSNGKSNAVKVEEAPNPFADLPTVEGKVTAADATSVTLDTADGIHVIQIKPEDEFRMEPEHLAEDHKASGEPVRIFYVEKDGTKYGRSFEDA